MAGIEMDKAVLDYLAALQSSAMQLAALLEAVNGIAEDDRRRPLLLQIVADALEIASELNHALDSVTVARALEVS